MDDAQATIKLDLTPHVLTCANVATLLQVPEATIDNLHRTGQLRGFTIGKHLRWSPDAVRAFAEQLASNGRTG